MNRRTGIFAALCAVLAVSRAPAAPLGTGFMFQGQLKSDGAVLNGTADLTFTLFDAAGTGTPPSGGVQIGAVQTITNVAVSGGLFNVTVNGAGQFGATAFNGQARWLQIAVRSPAGAGAFATLSPRQPVTGSPYALGPWQSSGANLFYSGGHIGIGTAAPTQPLDVRGPLQIVNTGDQAEVLWLGIERSWAFKQEGAGASTALKLESVGGGGNKNLLVQTAGAVLIGGAPARHLAVAGDGNVGIGTTSPQAKLDVNGAVASSGGYTTDHSYRYVGTLGEYWRMGARSVFPVCSGANIEPFLELKSPYSGNVQVEIYRDCQSKRGVIVADQKNFRAPNPADPTTDIWYCAVEGPEAAMYARGTAQLTNGRATITLPDHFRSLAVEAGLTVQVTPLSLESKGLAVVRKSLAGIDVGELGGGTGTYEFDWRVEAVRKGHEDYQVIRPWKPSDEDEAKAWNNRIREIQERRARGEP